MPFLENEVALYYIDQIKRSNCIILSTILNNYWSSAAFDENCLDHQAILNLITKIKHNGLAMQKICQNQPSFTPWAVVKSKKKKM